MGPLLISPKEVNFICRCASDIKSVGINNMQIFLFKTDLNKAVIAV